MPLYLLTWCPIRAHANTHEPGGSDPVSLAAVNALLTPEDLDITHHNPTTGAPLCILYGEASMATFVHNGISPVALACGHDFINIIDDPGGDPVYYRESVGRLFSNTSVRAAVTASSGRLIDVEADPACPIAGDDQAIAVNTVARRLECNLTGLADVTVPTSSVATFGFEP